MLTRPVDHVGDGDVAGARRVEIGVLSGATDVGIAGTGDINRQVVDLAATDLHAARSTHLDGERAVDLAGREAASTAGLDVGGTDTADVHAADPGDLALERGSGVADRDTSVQSGEPDRSRRRELNLHLDGRLLRASTDGSDRDIASSDDDRTDATATRDTNATGAYGDRRATSRAVLALDDERRSLDLADDVLGLGSRAADGHTDGQAVPGLNVDVGIQTTQVQGLGLELLDIIDRVLDSRPRRAGTADADRARPFVDNLAGADVAPAAVLEADSSADDAADIALVAVDGLAVDFRNLLHYSVASRRVDGMYYCELEYRDCFIYYITKCVYKSIVLPLLVSTRIGTEHILYSMIDKEIKASLKKSLRRARRDADLTQQDVADAVGTKVAYYAKIERGEVVPSLKMLGKIVRVLKTDSTEVLPF